MFETFEFSDFIPCIKFVVKLQEISTKRPVNIRSSRHWLYLRFQKLETSTNLTKKPRIYNFNKIVSLLTLCKFLCLQKDLKNKSNLLFIIFYINIYFHFFPKLVLYNTNARRLSLAYTSTNNRKKKCNETIEVVIWINHGLHYWTLSRVIKKRTQPLIITLNSENCANNKLTNSISSP